MILIKFVLKYLMYLIIYIYLHVLFTIFLYNYCFLLKTQYINDFKFSYIFLSQYAKYFDITKDSIYNFFDNNVIKIEHKKPIMRINNIIFFDYRIGIYENYYSNLEDIKDIPYIISHINLYDLDWYLVKLIYNQYISLSKFISSSIKIELINKRLVLINTDEVSFYIYPWHILTYEEYYKIIKEKILDLRVNDKNKKELKV